MKKFVVYPDSMLDETSEVLSSSEPWYLHSVLWVVAGIMLVVGLFVTCGKIDDVVKANGMVRPVMNVSTVNNIVAGEIEELFYKPGDFVKTGDRLLSIRGRNVEAREIAAKARLDEVSEKLKGLGKIIDGFDREKEVIGGINETFVARYEAYAAEKKLRKARVVRCWQLYELEKKLPDSATTQLEIENRKYDFEMAQLELEDFCSNFISEVRQERDAVKLEQENLVQEIAQIREEMRNLVLVSPVDGYVQEMSSLNVGDYVFVDQQVLNIVPVTDGRCRIELRIPAEKMGKLEEGQCVKLRFPAFPYSEFKGKNGRLNVIQPDAVPSENGLYFTAYAEVDSMDLMDKKGRVYEIKPGFEVDARIVLENQTLLYFLLKKLDFTV